MQKTYIFHTDPSHGWLEVPMSDIKALGIWHKITACSYYEWNIAFLEEDCDAVTFVEAAKAMGWEIKVKELNVNTDHRIRDLNSWGDWG